MLNSIKKIFILSFVYLCMLSIVNSLAFAAEQDNKKETNDTEINDKIEHINNDHIMLILDSNTEVKPLEEITVLDIIQNEQTSPELRERIVQLLNQSQYEIDKYRTTISAHYKQVENKLFEFRKELNKLYDFRDNMEINLNLAKWMIISLSVGIVCLTTIVIVMWKSVVNVNRNDVEVIYSNEQLKKKLRAQEKRIELLEIAYKRDGKDDY